MIGLMHGRTPDGHRSPSAHTAIAADFPAATAIIVDGDTVDLVAVARRLDGDRVPLTPTETRFAAVYGTTRLGMSAKELGKALGVDQRMVVRWRVATGVSNVR